MTKLPPIEQLLPHDKPMILVDRALDVQQDTIHCQVDIGDHNPFFNQESLSVPAYVGIEFMAQSVAAWSGYHALTQGEEPPIGFFAWQPTLRGRLRCVYARANTRRIRRKNDGRQWYGSIFGSN